MSAKSTASCTHYGRIFKTSKTQSSAIADWHELSKTSELAKQSVICENKKMTKHKLQ